MLASASRKRPGATPSSGFDVVVTIYWKPPSVVLGPENQYTAAATVRMN